MPTRSGGAEHAGTILMNLMKTPGAAPLMELAFTDPDLTLEGVAKTNQMRHLIDMQLAELFADVDILLVPRPCVRVRRRGPDPDSRRGRTSPRGAGALHRTVQPLGQPGRLRAADWSTACRSACRSSPAATRTACHAGRGATSGRAWQLLANGY
jgi:hypothetical protein